MKNKNSNSPWNRQLLVSALFQSFEKLSPKYLIKNPVMFLTAIGALISLICTLQDFSSFNLQITCWLWFTVIFANFSEALAEGRGKAQAESLRNRNSNLKSKIYNLQNKKETEIDAKELNRGDIVICYAGDIIPMDGEVIQGVASVDESAITGESAPVIRESGGDRSAVTGGTQVKSDWLIIKITSERGKTFVDKMIHLIEGAKRQKTPNEIALSLVLIGLSVILLCVVFSLNYFFDYSAKESGANLTLSLPILISLLVCLIPTTIAGLLSAIGISGMNRLIKNNVVAKSGRAVEAAGDISVLLLDKTGTITHGNRMANEFYPIEDVSKLELAQSALLASYSDETAEGRSIVELSQKILGSQAQDVKKLKMNFIPFSAETRMSGVDMQNDSGEIRSIRKGAVDSVIIYSGKDKGTLPQSIQKFTQEISQKGGTPLLVIDNKKIMGLIYLKDIVKAGIKEKFAELRRIGIKTIMITGDNPLTAASIAAEAGVDDFIAQATPEDKLKKIREEQAKGHLVAMTGDGTNDAPALAQADVGVVMGSGTQAAREAGNMVDLDSDPTKLITVVEVGKQLLITRGALTTFSFANDIAKYFAILPAMFVGLYASSNANEVGVLGKLNIMNLASPESSILSAVIFNALIIIILTPLALRGVKIPKLTTDQLLTRNVLIYGLGGVVAPFIGIKIIDLFITTVGLV